MIFQLGKEECGIRKLQISYILSLDHANITIDLSPALLDHACFYLLTL